MQLRRVASQMTRGSEYVVGALVMMIGKGIGVCNSAKVSSCAKVIIRREVVSGLLLSGIWSRTHCRKSVTDRVVAIVVSSGIS